MSAPASFPSTPGEVVRQGLCIGCGFCTASNAASGRMTYDAARAHFVPEFPGDEPQGDNFVCPGREMDMPALARAVHGRLPPDPLLGEVVALRAGHALDPETHSRAASGGAIPALLTTLFNGGKIDCAYCVEPGTGPTEARGVILRRATELARTSGSVYHAVNFGAALPELLAGTERFAFVGLPCSVAALEQLKLRDPSLASRHVMSIGLFCGGINTFKGVAYYLEGFGISGNDVAGIAYRHGPWPGAIRVNLRPTGETRVIPRIRGNTRWKILRYVVAFQGYWMLPRCRICPDQVADFADVAVGDPHLPRFRARGGRGFSVILSRTARGEACIADAISSGVLHTEEITREEVVESQGYTLDNRRHALVYARVARQLGLSAPRLSVYPLFANAGAPRHRLAAWVDMSKLRLARHRWLRPLYIPWQIFEYTFLTFAPRLVLRRIGKLLSNR